MLVGFKVRRITTAHNSESAVRTALIANGVIAAMKLIAAVSGVNNSSGCARTPSRTRCF